MQEPTKKEDLQTPTTFSWKPFLKLRNTWLVIIGALMIALSPFPDWVTGTISGGFPPLVINYPVTITGHDATWNLTLGPLNILRMIYLQIASLALAVLVLLLRIFFPSETPKWSRSTMLIISGILGVTAPAYFIYVNISRSQQLSSLISQFQWAVDLLRIQYNFSVGPGLILAVLGSILMLISGVLVLREKA